MNIECITWQGWRNVYRLSNDVLELLVTTDVGPRIISCRLLDGENLLYVDEATLGQTGALSFQLYGGHRFWLAPEHMTRTYQPDNHAVDVQQNGDMISFTAPVETQTGMQKTLRIQMDGTRVTVEHHLYNHNLWDVSCSLWALSVMRTGGVMILPLPQRGDHGGANLLPNTQLVLWAYTDMTDARWRWGREFIMLHQDAHRPEPQKIGALIDAGWLAYLNEGTLFLKQFDYIPDTVYPDRGCNAEVYTNNLFLELESLSPLQTIPAGGEASHKETWYIVPDVPAVQDDADIHEYILPHLPKVNP
jgi:hypothetical protein